MTSRDFVWENSGYKTFIGEGVLQLKNREDFFKLTFWPNHDMYFSEHIDIACAALSMAFPKMNMPSTNNRCDIEGPSLLVQIPVKFP